MKILMVNKFLYISGGAESYMFNIVDYLRENGHEVSFFGMEDEKNIVSGEYNVNNTDFKAMSLKKVVNPFKLIYSKEAKVKMEKTIINFKPDIIHLHNYNYQLTPSIIYAAKKYKIPVIQTIHDPNIVCPYHRLYNFQKNEICEKCKNGKYINCVKTKCIDGSFAKSLIGTIEAYLYKKLKTYDYINKFICPSQFMNDKIVEFGVDKNKTTTVYNFINKKQITREDKKNDKYVLYFGRISYEKGIKTIIKSSELLPDIKFKICGTGPLLEELKEYVRLNKNSNVEFLGYKSGEELLEIIRNAAVTVYPSIWFENCPMSIIESKCLGVPVIGSNIGGIPELINDNVDGLIFEPDNFMDLADKIKSIINDDYNLDRLSKNCLQDYEKRFTAKEHYKHLIKIYTNCLNNRVE